MSSYLSLVNKEYLSPGAPGDALVLAAAYQGLSSSDAVEDEFLALFIQLRDPAEIGFAALARKQLSDFFRFGKYKFDVNHLILFSPVVLRI